MDGRAEKGLGRWEAALVHLSRQRASIPARPISAGLGYVLPTLAAIRRRGRPTTKACPRAGRSESASWTRPEFVGRGRSRRRQGRAQADAQDDRDLRASARWRAPMISFGCWTTTSRAPPPAHAERVRRRPGRRGCRACRTPIGDGVNGPGLRGRGQGHPRRSFARRTTMGATPRFPRLRVGVPGSKGGSHRGGRAWGCFLDPVTKDAMKGPW